MNSERQTTREVMRETVARIEAARAAGDTKVIAALTEVSKAFRALNRLHRPPDPIATATLARILKGDQEALALYLEALRQNQVFPDEQSYEWRLPLAARFVGALHIQTIRHELLECRTQAAAMGDQNAASRAETVLLNLPDD